MGDFSIQISTKLVSRLVDDTDKKLKKKPKRNKTKVPSEPPRSKTKADHKQISDDFDRFKGHTASGWPHQTPLFLPVIPPEHSAYTELDAIRSVLKESEKVLERLQKQEENMVEQVTQRAKDLHEKEFKLPYQKPMPCLAESDACFQCYKEHPNNLLKCAHLVKNFADCNRRARQQVKSAEK